MKDILLDVNSGDVLFRNLNENVTLYDTVWGNLFPGDTELYLNIIIPGSDISYINYVDGSLTLFFHAVYHPVCEPFTVRLVVQRGAGYEVISVLKPQIKSDYQAYTRFSFLDDLVQPDASQLPLIDLDGNFMMKVKMYYGRRVCEIASSSLSDFDIGDVEDQSAQLLAICAPGKYYRYPTTGVDVTKYINSVVPHTDMAENTLEQFNNDGKYIQAADFDSETGNLTVAFSGDSADNDAGNVDLPDLDLSVIKSADDDYVRGLVTEDDDSEVVSVALVIPDVDTVKSIINLNKSEAQNLTGTVEEGYIFDANGDKVSRGDYAIVTSDLHEGDLLQFNLPIDYDFVMFFKLLDEDDNVIYTTPIGENWNPGADHENRGTHYSSAENLFDRCAIILKDCKIQYNMKRYGILSENYWIKRSQLSDTDISKLIVLAVNKTTGLESGYISNNSSVVGGHIVPKTGEIQIITR